MLRFAVIFCVCVSVSAALAAKIVPGRLHIIEKCESDIKIEPTDMIELRIPNPALPKRVHDVDVDVTGDVVLGGVVDTTNGLPGGDRISIFIGLKSASRGGVVEYSYKNGEGESHRCKTTVQVIRQ